MRRLARTILTSVGVALSSFAAAHDNYQVNPLLVAFTDFHKEAIEQSRRLQAEKQIARSLEITEDVLNGKVLRDAGRTVLTEGVLNHTDELRASLIDQAPSPFFRDWRIAEVSVKRVWRDADQTDDSSAMRALVHFDLHHLFSRYGNAQVAEPARQQIEAELWLVTESDELLVDRLEVRRRSTLGGQFGSYDLPLRYLTQRERRYLERDWQQRNSYRYSELQQLTDTFIGQTLGALDMSLKQQSEEGRQYVIGTILPRISPALRAEPSWRAFTSLLKEGPNALFTVLDASSRPDRVTLTLLANLNADLGSMGGLTTPIRPIVFDLTVERHKQNWLITGLADVRNYALLSVLEKIDPELFEKVVKIVNYRNLSLSLTR